MVDRGGADACMLMSEEVLREIWDMPAEDEAWAYLDQAWFWSPEWQAKEREADEDVRLGNYRDFDSIDEMIAALDAGELNNP